MHRRDEYKPLLGFFGYEKPHAADVIEPMASPLAKTPSPGWAGATVLSISSMTRCLRFPAANLSLKSLFSWKVFVHINEVR